MYCLVGVDGALPVLVLATLATLGLTMEKSCCQRLVGLTTAAHIRCRGGWAASWQVQTPEVRDKERAADKEVWKITFKDILKEICQL